MVDPTTDYTEIPGTVVEVLPDFELAHVEVEGGFFYGVPRYCFGREFESVKPGSRVALSVRRSRPERVIGVMLLDPAQSPKE
jgi:hypothetical protein